MHVPRLLIAVALIGSNLVIATPMAKADLTLGAAHRGWIWDVDFGANGSGPGMSYFVGSDAGGGGIRFRNWFIFDLAGVLTPVTNAELLLHNPGIVSDDGSEIYQLTSTTSTTMTLIEADGGEAVFDSLGTGTVFSTLTVLDPEDDGATLSLALNSAGLAFLNANLGELVAFSGRLTTLDGSLNEFVFGGTGAASSTDLHLTCIPSDDLDGDGVPDDEDNCPNSDLGGTLVIDGCDTEVPNQLFSDGCSMADLGNECADGTGNHGAFVGCVAQLTNDWKQTDLITGQQKGRIQSCVAQADIWMPCQTNADCNDGLFCNGVEICLEGDCVVGDPCPGQGCDEVDDVCVE